jgi:hypothetical protein
MPTFTKITLVTAFILGAGSAAFSERAGARIEQL